MSATSDKLNQRNHLSNWIHLMMNLVTLRWLKFTPSVSLIFVIFICNCQLEISAQQRQEPSGSVYQQSKPLVIRQVRPMMVIVQGRSTNSEQRLMLKSGGIRSRLGDNGSRSEKIASQGQQSAECRGGGGGRRRSVRPVVVQKGKGDFNFDFDFTLFGWYS